MSEELRALLRSDLDAERPPPIGDIVGAAIRAGRRTRRERRNRRVALGVAVTAVLVLAGLLLRDGVTPPRDYLPAVPDGTSVDRGASMPSLSPETVPMMTSAPIGSPPERTVTSHDGTTRAGGEQKKATSAAMLQLLTELVRPATTGEYGVFAGDDLSVRLFVDSGAGAGTLAVTVGRSSAGDRRGQLTVDVSHTPGDCARTTTVTADRPDGVRVRLDIASCPSGSPAPSRAELGRPAAGPGAVAAGSGSGVSAAGGGALAAGSGGLAAGSGGLAAGGGALAAGSGGLADRGVSASGEGALGAGSDGLAAGRGALTADQGVAVVSDPRWGFTMDAGLVDAGSRSFPAVPVVAR